MTGWRGSWAAAQTTGVLFSSLVWIVVWGLSLPGLALIVAVGFAVVLRRNTRAMLWCRFGASPADDFQRGTTLTAIVPIASLRGRDQPSIWIGRRIVGGDLVMSSSRVLVVSPKLVRQIANGQMTDRQASAITSQALGHGQVVDSVLVNALAAYCVPWRFVQLLVGTVSKVAACHGILRSSWKIRWIVFGVAAVDNYLNARWPAFVGVVVIAVLSWTTGHCHNGWERTREDLGDQHTIAEGLGPDLADLIQCGDTSLATSERANRLRRGSVSRRTWAAGPTADRPLWPDPSVDRHEHRSRVRRRPA